MKSRTSICALASATNPAPTMGITIGVSSADAPITRLPSATAADPTNHKACFTYARDASAMRAGLLRGSVSGFGVDAPPKMRPNVMPRRRRRM